MNRLGLAREVDGGVWLLGRSPGEEPKAGKKGFNCVWAFWAVHFAGEHLQMTNGSDFRGLNVSYNSWLMSPLAVTTSVSIPFDMRTLSTWLRQQEAAWGSLFCTCTSKAELPCVKGSGKVRSVHSGAFRSQHTGTSRVFLSGLDSGLLGLRFRGWLSG